MTDQPERDAQGRWLPGQSANETTKWGPDNPPPKSPGRPRKDAWLAELQSRLEDSRIRNALADKLIKLALKGRDATALRALAEIQDRVGGPLQRASERPDAGPVGGVLVVPSVMATQEWLARHATPKTGSEGQGEAEER